MTSKTSWDKRAKECALVYKFALRTGKSLGITLFCLCMLIGPVILLLVWLQRFLSGQAIFFSDTMETALLQAELFMGLGFVWILLFMGNLFGYMHDRGAVDLFHALPLGRVPMLLGRFFAALTHLLVPMAAGLFLSAVLAALARGLANGLQFTEAPGIFRTYGEMLAVLVLMQFAFLAFSVFLCVCCGNTANTVLSILAINVGWCLLVLFGTLYLEQSLPGMPDYLGSMIGSFLFGSPVFGLFSPAAAGFASLVIAARTGAAYSPELFVWWAVFGVALFFLSLWLYQRRRSEAAGESFAFSVPRVVIRTFIALAAAILFGTAGAAVFGGGLSIVLMGIGLVFGHVLSEAVFQRGFSTEKKALPALGITAVGLAVAMVLVSTGGLGYVTRVPAAADVASIAFDTRYYSYIGDYSYVVEGEDPGQVHYTNDVLFTDPDDIAAVRDAQERAAKLIPGPYLPSNTYRQKNVNLTYALKDGSTFRCSYSIWEYPELQEVLDTMTKQENFKAAALLFSAVPADAVLSIGSDKVDVSLDPANGIQVTPEQLSGLQQAMLQDQDDILEISLTSDYVEDAHYLDMQCTGVISTAGNQTLEQAFHTQKPVHLNRVRFYFSESGAPHLTAVCKDLGLL